MLYGRSGARRPSSWCALWAGCLALLLAGCAHEVELLSQITEGQANDVIAALSDQGIVA